MFKSLGRIWPYGCTSLNTIVKLLIKADVGVCSILKIQKCLRYLQYY